jgi:carbonic anhydrase
MLRIRRQACSQSMQELLQNWFLFGTGRRPQSLWITCTDIVMDRVLEKIEADGSAIVLRQSAALPDVDGLEVIDYAVECLDVRDIVICGHSMCSGILVEERAIPRNTSWNSIGNLMQRVRQREVMNDRARSRAIRQLIALESHPSVGHAISRGDLSVHALFYLTESGIFTRYDKPTEQFVAI